MNLKVVIKNHTFYKVMNGVYFAKKLKDKYLFMLEWKMI